MRFRNILLLGLLCLLVGCEGKPKSGPLRWPDAEDLLQSSDVKTIEDFYLRLAEIAEPASKRYLTDPKSLEYFEPMAKVIEHMRLHEPELTPQSAKDRIARELIWKNKAATIDDVARSYSQTFSRSSKAEDIASWGRHIGASIYTDDRGVIIGWTVNK